MICRSGVWLSWIAFIILPTFMFLIFIGANMAIKRLNPDNAKSRVPMHIL